MGIFWFLTFCSIYLYVFYRGVRWAWRVPSTTRKHTLQRAAILAVFLSPALLVGGEGFAVVPYAALFLLATVEIVKGFFTTSASHSDPIKLVYILGWNTIAVLVVIPLLYSLLGIRHLRRTEVIAPWLMVGLTALSWLYWGAATNWYANGVFCESTDQACYARKAAATLDRSICDRVSGPSAQRVAQSCLLAYAAYSNDLSVCSTEGARAFDKPEMYRCVEVIARRIGDRGLCLTKLVQTQNRLDCQTAFGRYGPLKEQELF